MQVSHGIPGQEEFSYTCFASCERATGTGASRYPGHTVGQARSASVKPTSGVGLPSLKYTRSFFMGSGARQGMDYCWGTCSLSAA